MQASQSFDGIQTVFHITLPTPTTLLQLLETIFDDITIYNNPQIYKLITSSPKGFIPIQTITKLPIFSTFLQQNSDVFVNQQRIIRCVNQQSRKLIVCNNAIRRVESFVDNIKNKKLTSVYVQKMPNTSTTQIIQYFKNIVGVVYQIYHKKCQRWAILVIDNYKQLQKVKNQLYMGKYKLNVLTPLQTLVCYGENQRLNSDFNILKLYENKCLITIPYLNQQQRYITLNRFQSQQQYYLQNQTISKQNQAIFQHYPNRNKQTMMMMMQQQQQQQQQQLNKMQYQDHQLYLRNQIQNSNSNLKSNQHGYRYKPRQLKDFKLSKHFQDQHIKHRARALQMQRNLYEQTQSIRNFDNTPLLSLRYAEQEEDTMMIDG